MLGHSWEAFIIEQVFSIFKNEYDSYYYRSQDGAECDIVLTKADRPIACVEIKFTSTPKSTRSLTTAIQDLGTKHNYIIIPECIDPYPINTQLTVCNIYQFIEKINQLQA